jgi:hypothetical protein
LAIQGLHISSTNLHFQESNTSLEGQFGTTLVFNTEKEMEHIARINRNWHSILK